jgi:hypothetical protein
MIFRTCVKVACAVPGEFTDSVAYAFGVNAANVAEAIRMTFEAAKDAVDREGDYIGGVVIETACRCAYPDEFEGAKKYFHRPMSEPGIFYVTGVTYTGFSKSMSAGVATELAAAKEKIARFGLPPASFTHPQLPEEPPTQVRMVCAVCGRWVQVSNAGLIYSFMSGLDMDSEEAQEAVKTTATASPFVRRHLSQCGGMIEGVQEDDPRWAELDEDNREDENAQSL